MLFRSVKNEWFTAEVTGLPKGDHAYTFKLVIDGETTEIKDPAHLLSSVYVPASNAIFEEARRKIVLALTLQQQLMQK